MWCLLVAPVLLSGGRSLEAESRCGPVDIDTGEAEEERESQLKHR